MNDPVPASGFIDKWRARWPEWALAMTFVPAVQRELVAAWLALLQELTDAAWGGDDPAPGLAKLAWWQEELQGWAKGARRHPLGDVLQARNAPWTTLARALPSLQASREPPDESDTAREAATDEFAQAVAACEATLFGPQDARDAVQLVAASLATERALLRPGVIVAVAPRVRGNATRVRRMHAALASARLRHGARPLRPWRALFIAWRAARA